MNKASLTRSHILKKAFDLVYAQGYRTTSIDDIIATTQVTKGAFYYHFKSKDAMGIALVDELLKPAFFRNLTDPEEINQDPLDTIYHLFHGLLMTNHSLKVNLGCPISNFTQEMSPWNADFSKALNKLVTGFSNHLIKAIEKGKRQSFIRKDVNAKRVTIFLLSGYWGIRNFGKLHNNKKVYLPYLKELKHYLITLK